MSSPAIVILPDVAVTSVVSALNVVDLPAPFVPSNAKQSPLLTENDKS
jgi:hypothetical protein